ncbi:ubiquinone/menaquinone biosynthesis methyltransferase [Collinsella tanakaei]|uniref:ubiquinone/menaquinone biosynthesis methyltransferase n=1 Tax=Collinsella tanakaei TaxID=626935 RepID=UPI001958BA84|nr:ubiquinone/menaquinone biosynthesis methyltransferase [Collinsella tanakaei]
MVADSHAARVRQIFSNIARRYDLFNALSSFGIYRSWLARTARAAACTPADRVLDVAGGTGDVAFELARRCPPASIELTDFTPEMLEVARERIAAGAARGVDVGVREVDAHNLPYTDGSFTMVTCAYGLRNFSDRTRAMREAARVLVPGGRYVVLEFATPPWAPWRALYGWYLGHMIPLIGGVLCGDRSGFEYLRDSIRGFPPQEVICDELRRSGFSAVSYRNCTGGIAAVYTAVK